MLRKLNLALLILPITIFSLGIITLLSTSRELVKSQLVFFLIGLFFYTVTYLADYSFYKYVWKYLYWFVLILLLVTFLFAEFRSGSARWLQFGPLSFQASELAKLILIISVSSYISENERSINKPLKLFGLVSLLIPMSILIFLQPDLGTVIILFCIFAGIVFFSDLSMYYSFGTLLLLGIFSAPVWRVLKDYQKDRILVFLNPQLDVLGSGYNVIQSLIAVGSGGFLGKGFGRGTQANLQFLPAYWTDFIFASFAEEWGFIGVFLLTSLYVSLLLFLIYISTKAKDTFGRLLTLGVFFMFFSQFLVNVGMNIGIMPVTGVTLPLVSYGGSSVLFSLISLGVVQNIWSKR